MGCETTDVRLSLLASPEAYVDESPASWIQYICAEHQYSFARLALIVGFKPVNKDWDLCVSSAQWEVVQKMSGATSSACAEARESFSQCFDSWKMVDRIPKSEELSVYQWCAHCFAEDRRPYLRWWWRTEMAGVCPEHAVPLSRRCECCGDILRLSRALMVSAGSGKQIPDLSHCQSCGMFLGGIPAPLNISKENKDRERTLASESDEGIVGIAKQGVSSDPNSKPPRFGHEIYLSTTGSVSTAIGKRTPPSNYVLNLTSAAFEAVPVGGACKSQNPHWSHQIPRSSTRSRQKLAYALRLIRQEKRLTNVDDRKAVVRSEAGDGHA